VLCLQEQCGISEYKLEINIFEAVLWCGGSRGVFSFFDAFWK